MTYSYTFVTQSKFRNTYTFCNNDNNYDIILTETPNFYIYKYMFYRRYSFSSLINIPKIIYFSLMTKVMKHITSNDEYGKFRDCNRMVNLVRTFLDTGESD